MSLYIIETKEIRLHRDLYRGDWVATPVGFITQAPRYGMYKFSSEEGKDIIHYSLERLLDSIKMRHDVVFGSGVKEIILQNVQNLN